MVSIKLQYEVTVTKMSADSPRLNQYDDTHAATVAPKLSILLCNTINAITLSLWN